ncbi:tetratricopeptide repeat protein, partial [Saccharothrix algeriensis]
MTGPAARADRAVLGDVAHSLVITGDRNRVVVSLTGSDLPPVRVRRPRRRSRAERLLFGAVGAVGAGDRPLLWLRPDAGVIRVRPRAEDAALRAWCDDGASRVRLVCGRGGQGKTTTARRLVADLRAEGWLAGFADLSGVTSDEVGSEPVRRRWAELAAAMGSRPVRRGRVLLVVDYAEDEPLALRRLLGLVRDAPSVRLLLLSRTEGDWWPALVADPAWSRLVDPGVVPLRSITDDLTPAEVGEVWVDAVRRFAARLGVEVAPTAPDRAFATTLDLYADALLRVLGADAADAGGDPVRGLLAHELRHVRAVLDEQRVPVRPGDQALALLAPFLAPAARVEEAAGALGALGVVADPDPAVLRRAARALGRLYPDVHDGDPGRAVGVWAPPRPDRLPDTHVLVVAAQAPSDEDWAGLVLGLCGGDDVGRAARVVRVLARCLTTPGAPEHHPDGLRRVALAVDRLVREHPKGYALPVVVLLPGRFTPALAAALAGLTTAEVAAIDRAVRAFGPSTRRAADAVLLSRRLARDTAPVPGADHAALGRHAGELHRLATDLSGAGQRQEAYAAARRAVEVYRGLVVAGREEHLPDLAAALSGLAGRLSEGGRPDVALTAARHAVGIREQLAAADPGAHLPGLATSLNNLAVFLAQVGRQDEALAPVRRAVETFRELAAARPEEHLADLARSLHNLGAFLVQVGRPEEGLEPARHAVGIRERLAAADPDGHLPDLAGSLTNLAGFLSVVGRRDEALPAARRAVDLLEELTAANPAKHLPDLVGALHNLATLLQALSHP